ncbi:MAG: RhuM family protein [Lutibacter sp.]|uniref:RhuM family protein n=1 Tax=Lutibacter sp. TaxID=1925666 RepID=UPI00299D9A0A|nr:RhuM family protein [Lutibacter sp.]MDX1828877.1 RhuM family protein [Lutibacter sp.]
MKEQEQIIIYQAEDGQTQIDVQLEEETIWLSQKQMAVLFDKGRTTIIDHIQNIFTEGELIEEEVCRNFRHTTQHGAIKGKTQTSKTKYYNLDVVISVGYRVKSKRGTQFRIWANKILKDYLVQGYAINEKLLKESNQKLNEFKKIVQLQEKVISEYQLETNETQGLIKVIANYSKALDLLDDYDHQRLTIPKKEYVEAVKINYKEARNAIDELGKQTKFEGLFGKEKDDSFKGSLENIYQTFDGVELYKTIEEKAAHLLYFVVKNHSFTDGNKRIAAFLFVWFLQRNNILYTANSNKIVSDSTLVALTLMLAQSNPTEKDLMIKVIMNLLINS